MVRGPTSGWWKKQLLVEWLPHNFCNPWCANSSSQYATLGFQYIPFMSNSPIYIYISLFSSSIFVIIYILFSFFLYIPPAACMCHLKAGKPWQWLPHSCSEDNSRGYGLLFGDSREAIFDAGPQETWQVFAGPGRGFQSHFIQVENEQRCGGRLVVLGNKRKCSSGWSVKQPYPS